VNPPGGPVSRTTPGRSQPHDAHTWLRTDDRRPSRPRGRAEYGQKSVQESGGGTKQRCLQKESTDVSGGF
jgi:hypothetical protein